MRIIAFIILAALAITNLTLERRLPPKTNSGPFINLQAFRSASYSVYCAAGFVSFLGLYTVRYLCPFVHLCIGTLLTYALY